MADYGGQDTDATVDQGRADRATSTDAGSGVEHTGTATYRDHDRRGDGAGRRATRRPSSPCRAAAPTRSCRRCRPAPSTATVEPSSGAAEPARRRAAGTQLGDGAGATPAARLRPPGSGAGPGAGRGADGRRLGAAPARAGSARRGRQWLRSAHDRALDRRRCALGASRRPGARAIRATPVEAAAADLQGERRHGRRAARREGAARRAVPHRTTASDVTLGEVLAGDAPDDPHVQLLDCPMLCSLQLNGLVDGAARARRADDGARRVGAQFRIVTIDLEPNESLEQACAKMRERYVARLPDGQPTAARAAGRSCRRGPRAMARRSAASPTRSGFTYMYIPERAEWAHPAALIFLSATRRGHSLRLRRSSSTPAMMRESIVKAGIAEPATAVGLHEPLLSTTTPTRTVTRKPACSRCARRRRAFSSCCSRRSACGTCSAPSRPALGARP